VNAIKTIATLIVAQFIFLMIFGAWGLLAIPIGFVLTMARWFWGLYQVELLARNAAEARHAANVAEVRARAAETYAAAVSQQAREAGWYMPSCTNLPVN
jgi:hypothetical protein